MRPLGPAAAALVAALAATAPAALLAIRPRFAWDTVGNMSFFHSCNESGLFSNEALDTIQKFPFVTVEKAQGFNDGSGGHAETKIVAQLQAVKQRDPTISTVFYMNSVLSWCVMAGLAICCLVASVVAAAVAASSLGVVPPASRRSAVAVSLQCLFGAVHTKA